jgi:hypothetical protein
MFEIVCVDSLTFLFFLINVDEGARVVFFGKIPKGPIGRANAWSLSFTI